jgi:hypothetical protein
VAFIALKRYYSIRETTAANLRHPEGKPKWKLILSANNGSIKGSVTSDWVI